MKVFHLSMLACIPLVAIGMIIDFGVFHNTPFWNIGKFLGVIALSQLLIIGGLTTNKESLNKDSST